MLSLSEIMGPEDGVELLRDADEGGAFWEFLEREGTDVGTARAETSEEIEDDGSDGALVLDLHCLALRRPVLGHAAGLSVEGLTPESVSSRRVNFKKYVTERSRLRRHDDSSALFSPRARGFAPSPRAFPARNASEKKKKNKNAAARAPPNDSIRFAFVRF